MTRPEDATPALASDPATPAQLLADIAQHRPDLRPFVATNPATYPGLLSWLRSLGDPAVEAALRGPSADAHPGHATTSAADPAGAGTPEHPTGTPEQPATGPAEQPAPAGWGHEPARGWGHEPARGWGQEPAQPWGQEPAQAWGQGPAQAWDQPSAQGGSAATGIDGGHDPALAGVGAAPPPGSGSAGDAPALPLPGGGYSAPAAHPTGPARAGGFTPGIHPGQWGPPPQAPRRSLTWLWVVLGVVVVLVIGGVLLVVGLVRLAGVQVEPGREAVLEELRDACAAEDWAACDELFREAPAWSDLEDFGNTCGGRTDGSSWCVDELGDGWSGWSDDAFSYGDDPYLDELQDACAAGDGQACDDLYWESPYGSEYEEIGSTCGGTTGPRRGGCAP